MTLQEINTLMDQLKTYQHELAQAKATIAGKEKTVKSNKTEQMVAMCQHPGCDQVARIKRNGEPYRYCKVHGAESRIRFKAMLEQNKAERDALRQTTIKCVGTRLADEKDGFLVRTARKGSAVGKDVAHLGYVENGYTFLRLAKGKSAYTVLGTVNAALAKCGAKDVFVMVQ